MHLNYSIRDLLIFSLLNLKFISGTLSGKINSPLRMKHHRRWYNENDIVFCQWKWTSFVSLSAPIIFQFLLFFSAPCLGGADITDGASNQTYNTFLPKLLSSGTFTPQSRSRKGNGVAANLRRSSFALAIYGVTPLVFCLWWSIPTTKKSSYLFKGRTGVFLLL